MRFTLPPRLIGTVAAAAIALTTLAAVPAHADDRRTARTIATILGIAAVGAIIHENKKDKKEERATHRRPAPKVVHRHVPQNNGYVQPRRHIEPRPLPQRVDRKQLPQNCLRSYQTRDGRAHMFGRRCLEQNYRAANRLPQNCAMQVRTNQGRRAGYDARCLRRNGYSLGRS